MQTRRLIALITTFSLCLSTQRALAGNDETYFLDSDAAIAAGAVVASSAGPGSVWYNPGGLARAERSNLSLSLSVASIQVRDYRDAIRITRSDGSIAKQSLDGGRVALLSPAISYVFKLRGVTLGGGLFTTRDDVLKVSATSRYTDDSERTLLAQTTVDELQTRYHLGGGAGFSLTQRLALGLSLFGVYTGLDVHDSVALSLVDPTQAPPVSAAATASWRDQSWRAGAQATLGLRYTPLAQLSLGLVLRTPLVMIYESMEASMLVQSALSRELDEEGGPTALVTSEYDPRPRKTAPFGMEAPARVTLGASYVLSRGVISLELDYSHPLRALNIAKEGEEPDWEVDRRAVFNVRAGALMRVTRTLELGGGLFTDRGTERHARGLGNTKVDYYGATFGARLSKFLAPAQGGTSTGLAFRTALAVRYALGTGSAGSLSYTMVEENDSVTEGEPAHVLFHELHAYLGTGVEY